MPRCSFPSAPTLARLRFLAPRVTLFLLVAGLSGFGQIVGCDTGRGSWCDIAATCGALCYLCADTTKDVALEENRQRELDTKCGECPEGQGCNLLESPPVCQKRIKPLLEQTTRVYIGEKGAACGTHAESKREYRCYDDAYCGGAGEPKRCVALHAKGEACEGLNQCAKNLYCDANTKTCTPLKGEGEPCDQSPGIICKYPLICGKVANRCLSRRKEGEACGSADPEGVPCEEALLCGGAAKKCVRYRKAGEACDRDEKPCASGLVCSSGTPHVCK